MTILFFKGNNYILNAFFKGNNEANSSFIKTILIKMHHENQ